MSWVSLVWIFNLAVLDEQRRTIKGRYLFSTEPPKPLVPHEAERPFRILKANTLLHFQQVGSFFQMVLFLSTIRPSPSLSCFAHFRRQIAFKSSAITVSRNGFSPFRRFFQASLQSGKFCRSKILSKARVFS